MKKATSKKLLLSRESVRNLSPRHLGAVAGGREVTQTCPGVCIVETDECTVSCDLTKVGCFKLPR